MHRVAEPIADERSLAPFAVGDERDGDVVGDLIGWAPFAAGEF